VKTRPRNHPRKLPPEVRRGRADVSQRLLRRFIIACGLAARDGWENPGRNATLTRTVRHIYHRMTGATLTRLQVAEIVGVTLTD
jgi:hypothetical protein